jgi:hypothetical protein
MFFIDFSCEMLLSLLFPVLLIAFFPPSERICSPAKFFLFLLLFILSNHNNKSLLLLLLFYDYYYYSVFSFHYTVYHQKSYLYIEFSLKSFFAILSLFSTSATSSSSFSFSFFSFFPCGQRQSIYPLFLLLSSIFVFILLYTSFMPLSFIFLLLDNHDVIQCISRPVPPKPMFANNSKE